MLHLTNGDSVVGTLEATGIGGTVVPWVDVLHEGPVPAGLSLDELRPLRARFLAAGAGQPVEAVERRLAERDAVLDGLGGHDEVVLWFEHDLYDQLQLVQLLDWIDGNGTGGARLSLICIGAFPGRPRFQGLGELDAAELASLSPSRTAVGEAELVLARRAWAAFRSPDPRALETLLDGDTTVLPFLAGALRRHLEQFPAVGDGLSRTERQLLESLAGGPADRLALFRASADREERPFMGDLTLFAHLDALAAGRQPLVAPAGGGRLALTSDGQEVLGGRADRVDLLGLDRWLGGVHLEGEPAWRWSREDERLTA